MEVKKVKLSLESLSPMLLDMLEQGMKVELVVTGNSMYPMLRHKRDSVILKKCDNYKLKKGDITLYKRSNGQFVLHRIVKVNDSTYDFCGDNQHFIEKHIPKDNIIAVVKDFERNEKNYSCSSLCYTIYWRTRIFSIPFRRLLYRFYHFVKRVLSLL